MRDIWMNRFAPPSFLLSVTNVRACTRVHIQAYDLLRFACTPVVQPNSELFSRRCICSLSIDCVTCSYFMINTPSLTVFVVCTFVATLNASPHARGWFLFYSLTPSSSQSLVSVYTPSPHTLNRWSNWNSFGPRVPTFFFVVIGKKITSPHLSK